MRPRIQVKTDSSMLFKIRVPGVEEFPWYIMALNDVVRNRGYEQALLEAYDYHADFQHDLEAVGTTRCPNTDKSLAYIKELLEYT